MADAAKVEEREGFPGQVPAPATQLPPHQQEEQATGVKPQEPLPVNFLRWPLVVLLFSYIILLYVRDATTAATSTKKEALGVVPSPQSPPHTMGQAPVGIHPERTAPISQDGTERLPSPSSSSSSPSLMFPIAGGGKNFRQHPHILVQYCTS